MVVFDLITVISMLLICRIPTAENIAVTLALTAVLSMFNVYAFYTKAKNNIDNGKFENIRPAKMADDIVKSMGFKKCLIYGILLIITLILVVMPIGAIRQIASGSIFALITTFFTSSFILPFVWTISYKPSKKQKKIQKEALN